MLILFSRMFQVTHLNRKNLQKYASWIWQTSYNSDYETDDLSYIVVYLKMYSTINTYYASMWFRFHILWVVTAMPK